MGTEQLSQEELEKLLPPNEKRGPFGGRVSDMLMLAESLRRTGRAAGLSEAAGEKTPANLKYPYTTTLGGGALGWGAGGLLGGLGGLIGGGVIGMHKKPTKLFPDPGKMLAGLGGTVGLGVGALGGGLYTYLNSVRKRRRLIEAVKEKVREKELNTNNITLGNPLASPFSGMHQLGKSDVLTGNVDDKSLQSIDNAGRVMTAFPGPLSVAGAGMAYGSNIAGYLQARKAHKTAAMHNPMNIFPPKSLGDKGIHSVLKDVSKRKKLTKKPFPAPNEVLDRAAEYLADKGLLRKKSELNKEAKRLDLGAVEDNLGVYIRRKREQEDAQKGIDSAYNSSFSLRHPYLTGIPTLGIAPTFAKANALEKIRHMLLRAHPELHNDVAKANELRHRREVELMPERIEEENRASRERMMSMGTLAALSALQSLQNSRTSRENDETFGYEKQSRCWEGFEPVPGKKAYSEGSCRPKTQTTKRVNEKRSEDLELNELVTAVNKIKEAKVIDDVIRAGSKRPGGDRAVNLISKVFSPSYIKSRMNEVKMLEYPEHYGKGSLKQLLTKLRGGSHDGVVNLSGTFRRSRPPVPFLNPRVFLADMARDARNVERNKYVDKFKAAEATVTVYFASPNRQLVRIPKDAVVSTDQTLAYQMGRYYPETKETWSTKDVSGKWTGGTPQPTFRAGRMPMGRPALYRAEVMQSDLGTISDMVKSVKKLRRSVNAVAVKQKEEKE